MRFAAKFFKQEASWEKLTAANSYSGDSFEDPETINVRWFTETSLVATSETNLSVTRVAKTFISTLTAVSTGDRITDENGTSRLVNNVRKNRATTGTFSHYVAELQ